MSDKQSIVLQATNISKYFALGSEQLEAIRSFSITLNRGEVVCLLGPSGCGKTTLLRILSGLEEPSHGEVQLPDGSRSPMLLFQDYNACLLPYYSVSQNVEIALNAVHLSNDEVATRVRRSLDVVGLHDFADAYPWQLSGGMKQRILLARVIAAEPPCVCLDEPFASVDALTRYGLEDELRRLAKSENAAVLYVSHDVDSAVYLADRILVLSGRPAIVKAEIPCGLGERRNQSTTRASATFAEIRGKVFEQLSNNNT